MRRSFRWAVIVIDAVLIVVATIIAVQVRQWAPFLDGASDLDRFVLPIAPIVAALWMLALTLGGAYRDRHWGAGVDEYRQVITSSVLFILALGFLAFLTGYPLSRGYIALLFVVGVPLLALGRFAARRVLHEVRRRGRSYARTLLVGRSEAVADLVAVLHREPWLGYVPVGVLTDEPGRKEVAGLPVVGPTSALVEQVDAQSANAAIFTTGSVARGRDFNETARKLEKHCAEMIVVPALTDVAAHRIQVTPVAGLPLMHVGKPQAEGAMHVTKRLFDIVMAVVILILLAPLLLVTALLVKLEDGGPVLFRQRRVGQGGRPFMLYKFRSMVVDAEKIRAEELGDANESDGHLFKIRKDPRITRIGGFIRRYSIDEIPQLLNVLKGEMSLIGPRPALEHEVQRYKSHVRRRLDVRPGMTGLWQVSGRSDLSWDDAVRLDLYYVDNWSMVQDLVILLRTFQAVVSSKGAY